MSLAASHHLKRRQFEVNLTQLKIWLLPGHELPCSMPTVFPPPSLSPFLMTRLFLDYCLDELISHVIDRLIRKRAFVACQTLPLQEAVCNAQVSSHVTRDVIV